MTTSQDLIARIKSDMRQAMKDNDLIKRDELRALLARISSAEAVPLSAMPIGAGVTEVARKELSFDDIHSVILDEIQEIEYALEQLDDSSEYAYELRKKLLSIRPYLA